MTAARRTGRLLFRSVAVLVAVGAFAVPAMGVQPTRVFVASTGNDANDGSRGAPKRNFQPAHDAVAAGGEVVALDTAGYGPLSINKSVSITAPAGITAFITTTGGATAITVGTAAADKVFLRGLSINAVARSGLPSGIQLNQADVLSVSDCTISGYANGIFVAASAAGAAVIVSDTTLQNNVNQGLLVGGVSAGPVRLVMERCSLVKNNAGVFVNASGTSGVSHRVELRDILATGNTLNAFSLFGANNRAALTNCTLSGNAEGAVVGSNAIIKFDACTITANTTGVRVSTSGSLLSRTNNTLEENDTNGAFTGTFSAK